MMESIVVPVSLFVFARHMMVVGRLVLMPVQTHRRELGNGSADLVSWTWRRGSILL
jgi:hypothetical protein